jgi:hypothetical protein
MTPHGRWPRRLRGPLLALTLLGGSGCLSFCHPVPPPTKEMGAESAALPDGCRNHVYIFLIHGLDPLDAANIEGLNDYLHALGYIKTYYGQLYHLWYFQKELARIHHEDPEARFVLIGFSFGANMVREVAQEARAEQCVIDLLVYLGGNTLEDVPYDRPDNVLKIVNILAAGCIWNGTQFEEAENIHVTDVWHFGSPTHKKTLEVLRRELPVVAARVQFTAPGGEPFPRDESEIGPTPRPVQMPQAEARRDAWDFLKPEQGIDRSRRPPRPIQDEGTVTIVPARFRR